MQGVCDGSEEEEGNVSPCEEHFRSCQHRRGEGEKRNKREGGESKEGLRLHRLAAQTAVAIHIVAGHMH